MFLGGTAGNLREILSVVLQKNPHARIVATAVSLESAAALTACMQDFKTAECVLLQAVGTRQAGRYHLLSGQNPIYIVTLQNPKSDTEGNNRI